MLKSKVLLTALAIAGVSFVFCKFGSEDDTEGRTVKALKISTSEISPWTEDDDGFREFSNLNELTTIMNGGADEYYNRNAIDGFFQYMSNQIDESTKYSVECRVIDFGTAENATAIFNYKITDVSTKEKAGNLELSVAVIDPDAALTGCTGYAHFGQYYIELQFTGYGSNKTESTKNAGSFIEVFEGKVKKM